MNRYILFFIAIGIISSISGLLYYQEQPSSKSVEFNLSELSPGGPSAGYAMPASGASLCVSNAGNSCSSPPNFCGTSNSSVYGCTGTCPAVTPADAPCTDFPIQLVSTPSLVRYGDKITLTWDLGLNYPTNCTLTGPTFAGFVFTDSGFPGATQTGSKEITVIGPHRFTLTCGASQAVVDIRILPELYET